VGSRVKRKLGEGFEEPEAGMVLSLSDSAIPDMAHPPQFVPQFLPQSAPQSYPIHFTR
jgi:hypothetical protein